MLRDYGMILWNNKVRELFTNSSMGTHVLYLKRTRCNCLVYGTGINNDFEIISAKALCFLTVTLSPVK